MKHLKSPIIRSTPVKLAFKFSLVYGLALGAVIGLVSWTTSHYVDAESKQQLRQQHSTLIEEYHAGGLDNLIRVIEAKLAEGEGEGDWFYLIADEEEDKIAGNFYEWPEDLEIEDEGEITSQWIDEEYLPRAAFEDDAFLPVIASRLDDQHVLVVALAVEQAAELYEIAEYLAEIFGPALLLAFLMSIGIARVIMRRVDVISQSAGVIMEGDLSERIPVSARNDEFDMLAIRLNLMVDRIEQLIKGIREVTDNIAHDLRSPLTRMRNRLEVAQLGDMSSDEYRIEVRKCIGDADSLIDTFNSLLGIAQAEAGNHRAEWESLDLAELAQDLVELYGPVAEEKGLKFEYHFTRVPRVLGGRQLLAQAIGNLLENAIKYTHEGGHVRLAIEAKSPGVLVTISDNGPGIPADEREHVLDRFVRLEASRNTDGNGLGLSLVNAIAKLHKAELTLTDCNPGLAVSLRFVQA